MFSNNNYEINYSFRDVEGVIARANKTEYGLASGVFTNDINKAMHVADSIKAGTVFVNTYNKTDVAAPFGGFKQSGYGKDLGKRTVGLSVFTQMVSNKINPEYGVNGVCDNYAPNFEKVGRAYCWIVCLCVCLCVCVLTFEW